MGIALGNTAATICISAPDSKAVPSLVPSASRPKLPPTGSAGGLPSAQPSNSMVAVLK